MGDMRKAKKAVRDAAWQLRRDMILGKPKGIEARIAHAMEGALLWSIGDSDWSAEDLKAVAERMAAAAIREGQ